MEAAVMNLQMMADVNGNSSKVMDAELEVKKLQELVRKLERQNEQLRTRANTANSCPSAAHLCSSSSSCSGHLTAAQIAILHTGNYCAAPPPATAPFVSHNTEEIYPYFHPQREAENNGCDQTALDEAEILDISALLPNPGEAEDTWLYVSPKAKMFAQSPLSPQQWCRHVLDNPSPEVELAKRSLCYRLEQAKRWRGVLSGYASSSLTYSPVVDGLHSLSACVKPLTKPTLTEQTVPSSPSSHCLLQQPLTGRSSGGLAERSPSFLYHTATYNYGRPHATVSPQSSTENDFSTSELEDDSISMDYKLQDMTDVQVMARLQEESLRQEYATTSATVARRSSSFSVHSGLRRPGRSVMDLEEEEEYDDLPPPQPRLFRTGSMQRSLSHSHNLSSPRETRRSPSSPQYLSSLSYQQQFSTPSPSSSTTSYTANEAHSYRTSTDKLRRSMPNLIRAPSMLSVPSVPSVPSVVSPASPAPAFPSFPSSSSSLRNSQSFDSSSGLARLQTAIPSPGQLQQRVQSIGNFSTATRQPLKATAYVSPTIQGPTTMPSSVSLNSLSSSGIPLPSKPSTSSSTSRSALPRPASFIGTTGTARSKIAQPVRSLLTPPKSVAALSALRDSSWKDGCY
ncbi:SLAIN motif-containing protein 1 isoform X1 [Astyanax mexicanus]|uniref:SLAIN motif family member 1 n=1 Tax=Astyanax mexicanus TaxID=7994 RepID=A0A8B9J8D1_ASTMX|nr:SLAIN motif-containing protein 1 isoform X1 [Astyanax mexicanus]